MNTTAIRALCINGTQAYYDYLDKNDRGLQRIGIAAILALPKGLFQVKINGNLFDTEAIFFLLKTNHKKLNSSQIQVVSYDKNSKTLILRPEEQYHALFTQLTPTDLEIISDLKFLVERVKLWYEKNGGALQLPTQCSPLKNKLKSIDFFNNILPSNNQKEAIFTIFNHPLSYIWGAPGTGKTQAVLSYALLHYLKNGYKVAILAPTNNAIEQVLRGVIAMTDKAKIQREQIIRLGTPSKAFADEFPEVCEARGIIKQLEELKNQAKIIEKVLLYKSYELLLNILQEGEGIFVELQTLKNKLDNLVIEERKLLVQINATKKKIERRQKQIQTIKSTIRILDRKIQQLDSTMARGSLHNLAQLKKDKAQLQQEYRAIEDEIDDFLAHSELLEEDRKTALIVVNQQKTKLHTKIEFIETEFKKNNATALVQDLLSDRSELVEAAIQKIKTAYQNNQVELGALADSYAAISIDQLKHEQAAIKQQQTLLSGYSTEERLKNVRIIAATLDGYIGRFMEEKLPVHHIFIDEAGYANIAKVLPLFNHRVPITLLGDHKQLPPVCEISDQTIARDPSYHDAFIWGQSAIYATGLFFKEKEEALKEYIRNSPLRLKAMQKADLNQTYRFGSNLAQVLNQYVYQNGFESAVTKEKTTIYYVDAPKPSSSKKKRENNTEALLIQALVSQIEDDFVILTPYRNQLKLLGDLLPQARKNQQIITVHGSQGREWSTVILSLVDTYDKWFTDSQNNLSKGLNLINTAVSRAKKQLIIVGDVRFWKRQEGQLIKGLLDIGIPLVEKK
ncbi:DEAD/DEAH box helicase [Aureispira anguillae]|uniref:AAA domain-containing protein n=1 Tax=Aureispira anguillae TaxID=2864201 RepID=A0A916DVG0_9BACT|nr:AAA domain-containing protein [Aureispira anguillae]BDS13692.1 AAA domain-containing protein [Aureispira anguillae]